MRAYSLIRQAPFYRREAFAAGLKAAGYEVIEGQPGGAMPGDVLVIWNRYDGIHHIATRFENEGGTVLVAENGYLGIGGTIPKFDVHTPKGPEPHHYYSISIAWHNGRGRWFYGGPERFAALGVELKPWRTSGEHILICPNRSFGVGEQVMPTDWAERTAAKLRQETKRPIVIRRHPGNDRPKRPLSADLENAWAVVIWSSGAGIHALAAGIPVICCAPHWIMRGATATGTIEDPIHPHDLTRLANFEQMAWSQWRLDEIEKGLPFKALFTDASK